MATTTNMYIDGAQTTAQWEPAKPKLRFRNGDVLEVKQEVLDNDSYNKTGCGFFNAMIQDQKRGRWEKGKELYQMVVQEDVGMDQEYINNWYFIKENGDVVRNCCPVEAADFTRTGRTVDGTKVKFKKGDVIAVKRNLIKHHRDDLVNTPIDVGCGYLNAQISEGLRANKSEQDPTFQIQVLEDVAEAEPLIRKWKSIMDTVLDESCCAVYTRRFEIAGHIAWEKPIREEVNENMIRTVRDLNETQEKNLSEDAKALVQVGWYDTDLSLNNTDHFIKFLLNKFEGEYAQKAREEIAQFQAA